MKPLELNNHLKERRSEKGLSQEELAKLVGTTRQTIISIEKKQFNPTTKLAILLSVALDCKVEDLFYLK
ncbi:MAG: helix-turn-helix transcriptional regulator [Clostridia bacterium]|nr:helix-turn-helix transcriptional regulator [Clostridia bacterium]